MSSCWPVSATNVREPLRSRDVSSGGLCIACRVRANATLSGVRHTFRVMRIGYGGSPPATRTPNRSATRSRRPAATRSSSTRRPASSPADRSWKALLSANRSGDQLVVTKLGRLGRSLEHRHHPRNQRQPPAAKQLVPPPHPDPALRPTNPLDLCAGLRSANLQNQAGTMARPTPSAPQETIRYPCTASASFGVRDDCGLVFPHHAVDHWVGNRLFGRALSVVSRQLSGP